MFLTFKDLTKMFIDYRGIRDADHSYFTVSNHAGELQPRGLFVPYDKDSGELAEAITNGAIAAIWDEKIQVPRYTPNHFPVFFTKNPAEAWRTVLQFYFEKLDGDKADKMNMTKFTFLNKELLKENKQTNDIAVMLEHVSTNYNHPSKTERRG